MTDVRLVGAVATPTRFMLDALGPRRVTDVRLVGTRGGGKPDMIAALAAGDGRPALLVSYAYWKAFAAARARYSFRDYSLDSGAYTVEHSGGTVDLDTYIAFCQERMATDPQCVEVFALDVISDWRKSQRNVERMWKAGVPAIPTYHRGEPEGVLRDMARSYPKIALGGCSQVRGPEKLAWVRRCFERCWPARVHGLAVMGEALLMAVPFHSVDASNWEAGPARFGSYRSMGKPSKAPRGKALSLRAEVEWYLRLESRLKQRWSRELGRLEATLPAWPLRAA